LTSGAPRNVSVMWDTLGRGAQVVQDVDCPTVRSQADGIVDGLSAALHDVTGEIGDHREA